MCRGTNYAPSWRGTPGFEKAGVAVAGLDYNRRLPQPLHGTQSRAGFADPYRLAVPRSSVPSSSTGRCLAQSLEEASSPAGGEEEDGASELERWFLPPFEASSQSELKRNSLQLGHSWLPPRPELGKIEQRWLPRGLLPLITVTSTPPSSICDLERCTRDSAAAGRAECPSRFTALPACAAVCVMARPATARARILRGVACTHSGVSISRVLQGSPRSAGVKCLGRCVKGS